MCTKFKGLVDQNKVGYKVVVCTQDRVISPIYAFDWQKGFNDCNSVNRAYRDYFFNTFKELEDAKKYKQALAERDAAAYNNTATFKIIAVVLTGYVFEGLIEDMGVDFEDHIALCANFADWDGTFIE